MKLHPQAQAIRDARACQGVPQLYTLSVEEARKADLESIRSAAGNGERVWSVSETTFPASPDVELPVRIYRPRIDAGDEGAIPIVLYFFGGGWTVGGIDTADGIARTLANAVPAVVVVPGYRLAPEHRFPAAVEDCYAALLWTVDQASSFGGEPGRVAVAGDSAGGNLAAAVALLNRDRGGPPLAGQALVYPNTDFTAADESLRENTDPWLFNATSVAWYRDNYLSRPEDALDPRASPLLAPHLGGLPSAIVLTAEYDPLRDQAERYARALAEAGVDVERTRYDGMVHGFFTMTGAVDAARQAQTQLAAALRRWFTAT